MTSMTSLVLAYTPFVDPINVHRWWYLLLVPMALGISVAYKAIRIPDLRNFPREVAVMTVQIVIAMMALGAASYFFVQYVVPMIVPK
jgi:hypothetical protein